MKKKQWMFVFSLWINKYTLIGWMRNIDEKNPVSSDVNHFWVFKSPNSIPRAIIKRIETAIIKNDNI